jgi:hypothetical protein
MRTVLTATAAAASTPEAGSAPSSNAAGTARSLSGAA